MISFVLLGRGLMTLTRCAAVEVMVGAVDRGLMVMKYEAGIWHDPGFEARVDGIMWCLDPYAESYEAVRENNNLIAFDLRDECPPECDAAIVSVFPYPYPREGDSPRMRVNLPPRGQTEGLEPHRIVGLRRWNG
jgi:hypothetical protein